MTKLTSTCLVLVLPLAVGRASTGTAQQVEAATPPGVMLPNTRVHTLRSQINGRAYRIEVALPSDYDNARSGGTRRYPTLYLLDGGLELPMFHVFMRSPDVSPNVLLVGVEAADSQAQRRDFDYTPHAFDDSPAAKARWPDGSPRFGGAAAFLRVLKEEVIPFVDRTYRTSEDRGLHGHSFGGLFAAYAMLEEPDLFTRYAITSPGFYWSNRSKDTVLALEPAFAQRHPTFLKHVFLSVGSEEDPGMARNMWQLATQLCYSMSKMGGRNYKGLDLVVETIAGETHASPVPHWHAMKALYPADSTSPKPRGVTRDCAPPA